MAHLLRHINRFLPIMQNTVCFKSYTGFYNDSCKVVSECLHRLNPSIKQYWIVQEAQLGQLPNYVTPVHPNTSLFFKCIYRSRVIVENYYGLRTHFRKGRGFSDFIKRVLCSKRNGQLDISLWHGTPFKKICADDLHNEQDFNNLITSCDFLVSGCSYTQEILTGAFRNKIPVKAWGTPRNDCFACDYELVSSYFKQKIGLMNEKVILFAPTFRNNVDDSGLNQLKAIDFDHLFSILNQKFGGEWVFIYRFHNLVLDQMDFRFLSSKLDKRIINGNAFSDMIPYLLCADILLTDYSSCMFDYLLSKKPCFLLCPDLDNYCSNERGTYLNVGSLPFPMSNTFDQLIDSIKSFNEIDYVQHVERFLNEIGNYEDGASAKRVAEAINDFCKTKNKSRIVEDTLL